MGTTIEMICLEKTDGLPFHCLSVEKQFAISEAIVQAEEARAYKAPDVLFSAGNHFPLLEFFEQELENLAETMNIEDDALYYYIDSHNVEQVVTSTRKEIDKLFETANRYSPETYYTSGTLNKLAEFLEAVQETRKEKGFENHYLIIDIG